MATLVRRLRFLHSYIGPVRSWRLYASASNGSDFRIIYPIKEINYEPIIQHLKKSFSKEEALNKAAGVYKESYAQELFIKYCLDTLDQRLSVMIVQSVTDNVAGVCLNGILRKGELENELEALKKISDEKYRVVFSKIAQLKISCNLFEKYQIDKLFECRVLSVDEKFRGLGIAGKLVQMSELVGKSTGLQLMKTELTSAFSQRIFAKQGHKVVLEKKYDEIKNDKGETVIQSNPPHNTFQISIKLLR